MMRPGLDVLLRDTARPFYQQIKDTIARRIHDGDWQPGEKVPSELTLVEELGVSRMTVNRALRELTQQGLLRRVHGVGTFVADPTRHASLIELKNIADEIRATGKKHRAETRLLERKRAGAKIAQRMELPLDAEVFHIVVVHYQDDTPIQLEDRLVNPEPVPGFMEVDFSKMTPTSYLMDLCRPDEIEHTVQAVMPTSMESRTLAIADTEPCLRLLRRTWKGGIVVTDVSLLYPGTRYDLVARYATDTIKLLREER